MNFNNIINVNNSTFNQPKIQLYIYIGINRITSYKYILIISKPINNTRRYIRYYNIIINLSLFGC